MKNYVLIFSILVLVFISSCKKEEMFNGNNSVIGRVFFANEVNQRTDTASSGTVFISQEGTTQEYEVQISAKGQYEIKFLNDGKFDLTAEMKQVIGAGNDFLLYRAYTSVTVKKDSIVTWNPVLRWENNTTALRILVTDSTTNANPVANASVYLYSAAFLMSSDTSGGPAGSIRAGVTNANGEVLFTGLQSRSYFYRAKVQIGQLLLDNIGGDTTTVQLPLLTLSSDTVVIQ